MLAGALSGLALASAALSVLEKVNPGLGFGGALAGLLAAFGIVIARFEDLLTTIQGVLNPPSQPPSEDEIRRSLDTLRGDLASMYKRIVRDGPRIELRLTERAAVDTLIPLPVHRPRAPEPHWDRGTPICTVYRDLGRQMLILGQPGAGKSTLLLELATQLLDENHGAAGGSLPLVFHLPSWAVDQRPLGMWLVDELRKYGVARRMAQVLVDDARIVTLLDGLDELPVRQRSDCVAAINSFHDEHGLLSLVVCCRTKEYEELPRRLELRGAIAIEPLTRAEVEQYLRQGGRPLAGLRATLDDDEQLWELLTTPLFLTIIVRTYRNRPAVAVRASGTLEERRQQILADYVETMLTSAPPAALLPYRHEQAVSWLTWLARLMRDHRQSVFHLDWIQPDCLPSATQQRSVTVGVAARLGVVAGLVGGLCYGPVNALAALVVGPFFGEGAWVVGLVAGSVAALAFGLVAGLTGYGQRIAPTEPLQWSWVAVALGLRRAAVGGVLMGASLGLIAGHVGGLTVGLLYGATAGLVFGIGVGAGCGLGVALVVGLVVGLANGLQTRPYTAPQMPGQGILTSRRNALAAASIAALVTVLGLLTVILLFGVFFDPLSNVPPRGRMEAIRGLLILGMFLGLAAGVLIGPTVGLAAGLGRSWRVQLATGLATALVAVPLSGLGLALLAGIGIGLQRGGGAYLRHRALRRMLVRNGATPKDYVDFLQYAEQNILLRRQGGGYEFIHPMVLDHFAALRTRDVARTSARPN